MRLASLVASSLLLSFVAGCGAGEAPAPPLDGPTGSMLAAAADAHGVPRDLMIALAQEEGGLGLARHRDVADDELVPVAGVLELRHGRYDSLARGAALMGLPELDLTRDLMKGTEAGARVLDDLARDRGVARRDALEDWASAVEELSGYLSRVDQVEYRARVFHRLRYGATVLARGGEPIALRAHEEIPIELTFAPPGRSTQGTAEFPGAIWYETPQNGKWAAGRQGNPITMIAVHDTEGGWDASVSTLQNDPGKSVHYIIDADGAKVGQFIYEADTGWHTGNGYYNRRSVGIEHVGYADKDDYQTALYEKSGELVRDIAKRNKLGPMGDGTHLDRSVMVGHQDVPNGNAIPSDSPPCPDAPESCVKDDNYGGANNHRDPGVYWEWCQYLRIIGNDSTCKCNDAHEIFNCVHDLSARVRCQDGIVEYEPCAGGCTVEPNGVDDSCAVVPTTGAGGAGVGGGGGVGGTSGVGGQGGAGTGGHADGGGGTSVGGSVSKGCSCAVATEDRGDATWALAALGGLFALRRRVSAAWRAAGSTPLRRTSHRRPRR